jgi:beta-phosphoglucomutase-like phosphatase (HAD superfamily)
MAQYLIWTARCLIHVLLDTSGEDYLLSRRSQPREHLNQKFKNMSLYQAACYYQSEYGLKDSTDEIIDGVNRMIEQLYVEVVQPKPGVPEFLADLCERGVKMCIATATDRHLVEAALSRVACLAILVKYSPAHPWEKARTKRILLDGV